MPCYSPCEASYCLPGVTKQGETYEGNSGLPIRRATQGPRRTQRPRKGRTRSTVHQNDEPYRNISLQRTCRVLRERP